MTIPITKTITITLLASSTIVLIMTITYSLAQDQPLTNQSTVRSGSIGLLILDVNASTQEDVDIYTIIGKVLNNSTVPFHDVRVSATLYDNNNQSLVERSAHTSPSGIQPGVNASFDINIFGTSITGGINAISNFTLQVAGDRQAELFQ